MIFRHRVNVRYDSAANGEVDPDYQTLLFDLPCDIVQVGGGEKFRGKQLQAETNTVIETRYFDGVLPNMIAVNVVSGVEYLISRILDRDGRKRFVIIEAIEVVV